MINVFMLALLACVNVSSAQEATTIQNLKTEVVEVNSSMTAVEKQVREAAVKVSAGQGHGSGGVVRYKDIQLVVTAAHVADAYLGSTYLIQTKYEEAIAVLIYTDPLHDIALLYLPTELKHTKGMKWNPQSTLTEVGTSITYSGYPSWHNIMTYRGHVAGYETHPLAGTQIMLNTYGWFGCSGSVIYNAKGQIVGVLWGVDVEQGQVQENMIWVAPIQNLNIKLALKPLCSGMAKKPKGCQ
jgi:S1-C subfamily serine protease